MSIPKDLARIHAAAFTQERHWSEIEFRDLLQSPTCFCVSHAHGFALGRVIFDEAELLTIAVLPDFQGRGFGKNLLSDFEDRAVKLVAKQAFLEVADDNISAKKVYKTEGYICSGTRAKYYKRRDGSFVDANIFTRTLT